MVSRILIRDELQDFEPLAQRAAAADPNSFIRLRTDNDRVSGFVQLPYDVIAGRTISTAVQSSGTELDITYLAQAFTSWIGAAGLEPARRDAHWLSALPPRSGWRRIEKVPDAAIRDVVRSGALLARDISAKNAQDSLLGSTVLTVSSATESVDVPLRALTALTKMGFLPRESEAAVDIAAGWLRVSAPYGSTFVMSGTSLFNLHAL